MDKKENPTIVEGMVVDRAHADSFCSRRLRWQKKGIVVEVEELPPGAFGDRPGRTQYLRVLWPGRFRSTVYFNDELVPVENQNEE